MVERHALKLNLLLGSIFNMFGDYTYLTEGYYQSLKVVNAIGNSLYVIDIKEVDGEHYVIAVNDKPSI